MGIKRLFSRSPELLKFTAVGVSLTIVQLTLQHFEAAHHYNLVTMSAIQGTLLANAGMVLNRWWTFKSRTLPWLAVFFCWNLQRIPHFIASTAMFVLLFNVMNWPHFWATVTTTTALGLGSYWLSNHWSMRPRKSKTMA